MTIPQLTRWSPKALLLGAAAIIGAFLGIITGIDALAEYQPFATKTMLAKQSQTITESIEALRWNQLSYGIDNLQFQLGQKQFQLIQLDDLIEKDPDQIKKDVRATLKRQITQIEDRLMLMRCQFEQRRQDPVNCQ